MGCVVSDQQPHFVYNTEIAPLKALCKVSKLDVEKPLNNWASVLFEAQIGKLTRNRKNRRNVICQPLVLAWPKAGSALAICDRMLHFIPNATINRGDLRFFVYKLNLYCRTLLHLVLLVHLVVKLLFDEPGPSYTWTTSFDLLYVLSSGQLPLN